MAVELITCVRPANAEPLPAVLRPPPPPPAAEEQQQPADEVFGFAAGGDVTSDVTFAPTDRFDEASFMHGELARGEAEGLISAAGGADGMFLVRAKGAAAWTVSLCKTGQFEHHMVKRVGGLLDLNGEPLSAPCSSLSELVHHLRHNQETLATVLATPVATAGYVSSSSTNGAALPAAAAFDPQPVAEAPAKLPPPPPPPVESSPLPDPQSFLHGELSRGAAEELIAAAGLADGMFLVREKGNDKFTLSVCKTGQFEHHMLTVGADSCYLLNGDALSAAVSSLPELVAHLTHERETLACCLGEPVAPSVEL
jgi:hypothetical protein